MLWINSVKNALKGRYTILQVTLLLAMILSLLYLNRGHNSIPESTMLLSQESGTFETTYFHLAEHGFY